ncbi:hypothetical protein D3C73_1193360 [compost metagenome]
MPFALAVKYEYPVITGGIVVPAAYFFTKFWKVVFGVKFEVLNFCHFDAIVAELSLLMSGTALVFLLKYPQFP